MYLKSLTLRGFKSFASATTLRFEPGITCVVGPNGSGKSNVVDALAWVMGEQGAKSLRGGKMEDVIFAGAAGRPALGRAEVALTIDNSDGRLPIEFSEVTISRTMFRNGGSEYAINGESARLLDIQELLSDSGIGHEMHVVVGQGQLDAILQATPESRRGFIEEAAGVLKHRKRKEKALRKLESTDANLHRLSDLLGELRRQLKPLGKQAEVARRAGEIQAVLLDAKARLLAEDLTRATAELAAELSDENARREERANVERSLAEARESEAAAEAAAAAVLPRLAIAQEAWYALAGLRERLLGTASIAAERVRFAAAARPEDRSGQDPEALERDAAEAATQEAALAIEVTAANEVLTRATTAREAAEAAEAEEEKRLNSAARALADRREGLARLRGQANSLRSRVEAAEEELGRLREGRLEAEGRAEAASRAFTSLETSVAGVEEGESGLDEEFEAAQRELEEARARLERLRADERHALAERATLLARLEGLRVGLERRDGAAALLAATDDLSGLLGSVAALVGVERGLEAALSAALGSAAEAVAVADVDAALGAVGHLKAADLGRAGLLLGGGPSDTRDWPTLPKGARYLVEAVTAAGPLLPALERLLRKVAVVDDLTAARKLVAEMADLTAVTRDGDIVSSWFVSGGSDSRPSLIEVQAAVAEAETKLDEAQQAVERLRFALAEEEASCSAAEGRVEAALARLHESDARHAALAEELGSLSQAARAAAAEAERLAGAMSGAEEARSRDAAALAELEERLELASQEGELAEPDPTQRDRHGAEARLARGAEMEARLALRTLEERARALGGRGEALRQAAAAEREARAQELQRREALRREGERAKTVSEGAAWLLARVDSAQERAGQERAAAESARLAAEASVLEARAAVRSLAVRLESLVEGVHRDELARSEQRMRIEALRERALSEVGIEADTLMRDYGPDQAVPVLEDAGEGEAAAKPYVREEQIKRVQAAERDLNVLGKVNPLALEEFDAMQERHAFLAEQLEDLRKTRSDLTSIVDEVDARVQEVFAEAYRDVEAQFEKVFARLFPGGEGRLVLTEPDSWLTTGIEVEARPAGKKLKRLSLLSGGERSLVAVAFLVSLFMARPSPFYILDEVEAALDDVNLGRLLEIYEELRANSQLLVITHQKRTMEIADALYGVTMRGDGESRVVSQRLRES